MKPISDTYFSGAQTALAHAAQCERDADKFDDGWRSHMLAEAKRHRKRARWYLRMTRAWMKPDRQEWAA